MPTVRTELVVDDGERDERDAGVQGFDAVPRRPRPADGDEEPAEEERLLERDALGGERPVALVHLVLVGVHRLIGNIELQDVQPYPEDDMGQTREIA